MKKIDLGQAITILANIGVIAGIAFLGFELQQNNDAMDLQARFERENTLRQGLVKRLNSPDLIRATSKALAEEELTSEDVLLLGDYNYSALMDWRLAYRQVQDGVLDESAIPVTLWKNGFQERFPRMNDSWTELKTHIPHELEFIKWFEVNVVDAD